MYLKCVATKYLFTNILKIAIKMLRFDLIYISVSNSKVGADVILLYIFLIVSKTLKANLFL